MDGGEAAAGRPMLGRSRGLLDFNIINTPNRFQQTSEASQRNAAEVKSILDNLPPIGATTQETQQPIPPRHILMNRFQTNEQNNNQQEASTTTPRRLINLGNTSPRFTATTATSNQLSNNNNNENSSLMNNSSMQNSSVIVFPPLPGETESNTQRLLLNSPKQNNEIPKPNFQLPNTTNAQDQSPEFAFEKLSQSPPSKQQESNSPRLLNVPIQSPKFRLQQPVQQSPISNPQPVINTTTTPLSPIYQQPPQAQPQYPPQQQQPIQLGQQQTATLSTPKASYQERLNQTLQPSTVGYSTELIGNSPRDVNYTEILPRKTPSDYFETSINNTLDRSFSTFKRSVTREISSVFRPNSSVFDVSAFDTFLTGLLSEVTNIFEVPPSILKSEVTFGRGLNSLQYMSTSSSNTDAIMIDNNSVSSNSNNIETVLVKKLTQNFDENAKPIRKMFADSEVKKAQNREKRVEELKTLSNALNELRNAVKTISDATLQELERERYDAASRRDEEQAKFRSLERRARSLKLKRADLDSKLNHQKMEKESMERMMKQMEDARREWEESNNDNGNSITQKLQKEIENIRTELNNDDSEKLDALMKECSSLMITVRDGLRDEIYEMDMAEKWAVSRLRSPIRRTPMSRFDHPSSMSPNPANLSMMQQQQQPTPRQTTAQFAQDKINEKRKERENAMMDLNNPYSYYTGFEQNQL